MTTDRRVEKVYDALTASERVAMILEDRKRSEPDDPLVRSTMPRDQETDLNRLLKDAGIANVELGMLILALHESARAEEWRWRWFEALIAHHNDLAAFCKELGKPKAMRLLKPPIGLDAPADETLAGRARVVLKAVRDAVVGIADQAYATAALLEEFSRELGGADPLRPQAREYLDDTLARATRLMEQLAVWVGPVECGEHDAYLDELVGIVATLRRRP